MKPTIPEAALNQHIAILGKTGSGKTFAAKGLVEWMLAQHRQVCVLDPTGAWWGLRLGADGKSRGHDVVLLGGKHADLPLVERSGAAVARLVTQQGANVVIDTSGFTVGEYTRWFIDFAGTLYTTIRNPLQLVIDEAHYFMPQGKAPDPEAGKMIHAGNRLMSGGRSLGIRGMMITQRPAKLHKDSLTCADTLIAMRVVAPQDRQAIKDWIDGCGDAVQGKAVLDSLAQLKRGEGWVWYPEAGHLERTTFPAIKTYDSSATPEHGAKAGPQVREIKLDEVRTALADAVREAEANDPKLLRRRIHELEQQAKKAAPAQHDQAATQRLIDRAVQDRDRHWQAEIAAVRQRQTSLHKLPQFLRDAAAAVEKANEAPRVSMDLGPIVVVPAGTPNFPRPRVVPLPPAEQRNGTSSDLSKMERRLLTVLAQRGAMAKCTILLHAGYASSGPISTAFGRMNSEGYTSNQGPGIGITSHGLAALGPVDPLPTGEALREKTLRELSGMEAKLLGAWFAAYPDPLSKAQVLDATGYASSGPVSTAFGKLSGRGFIVKAGGAYAAAGEFFL